VVNGGNGHVNIFGRSKKFGFQVSMDK
jgi:hypothetical protein